MKASDYLLIIVLMFINLIAVVYISFHMVHLEFLVVLVLGILDVWFIIEKQSQGTAITFFSVALLNAAFLFIWSLDMIFAIISIVNLLLIYYTIHYIPHQRTVSTLLTLPGEEPIKANQILTNFEVYYEDPEFKPIEHVEADINRQIIR
ncbi:MAG: hypothetical protein KKG59_07175 [Nanoarchaeota archaeon]|nr:hypothetical protein [Nanoarchaeota archaeon]